MFCSRIISTQMESFQLVWRVVVAQYNRLLRVTFDKTKIIKDHWHFVTIAKETVEPRYWEKDAYLLVLNPNKIASFFLMLFTETSGKNKLFLFWHCYFVWKFVRLFLSLKNEDKILLLREKKSIGCRVKYWQLLGIFRCSF